MESSNRFDSITTNFEKLCFFYINSIEIKHFNSDSVKTNKKDKVTHIIIMGVNQYT